MGREIKRVPLDFNWPLDKVWTGYLLPEHLHQSDCDECDGSGYSAEARRFRDEWYGYIPFDPASTGSAPHTIDTPEVRAFAERNVAHSPSFYGMGEGAIRQEAQRLATLWNGRYSAHLTQEDVDALFDEGRLRGFKERPTAAEVNRWSLVGIGHDSINEWIVNSARCKRAGVSEKCPRCGGHGSIELWTGQRALADEWTGDEPPTGEGWQLWETVSEGSPITPVFPTAEALVDHLVNVGDAWGRKRGRTWDRDAAERFVTAGWAPSMVVDASGIHTPEGTVA